MTHDPATPEETTGERRGLGKKVAMVAAVPVLLLAGCIGGSVTTEAPEPEVITKEVEVEVPAEAPEPEIITEEVLVEVTDESCLIAIANADELMGIYSEALTMSADMLEAVFYEDYATVEQLTADMEYLTEYELTPTLSVYFTSATECEGGVTYE